MSFWWYLHKIIIFNIFTWIRKELNNNIWIPLWAQKNTDTLYCRFFRALSCYDSAINSGIETSFSNGVATINAGMRYTCMYEYYILSEEYSFVLRMWLGLGRVLVIDFEGNLHNLLGRLGLHILRWKIQYVTKFIVKLSLKVFNHSHSFLTLI